MLPNFIIIGAAKAGTTALYKYLQQHPDIFMSRVKETNHFAFRDTPPNFQGPGDHPNAITSFDDYQALFQDASGCKAIGEASPMYLYKPEVAKRIKTVIPDVKLIVILRDPVERAYSAYNHLRRDGREPIGDFVTAVQEEENRIKANWAPMWHYLSRGYYYQQLKPYLEQFDSNQLLILFHEDLDSDPQATLQKVFRYLGVDDTFIPDTTIRHNVSGIPRSPKLHQFLTQSSFLKQMVRPMLPQKFRESTAAKVRERNLSKPSFPVSLRHELQNQFKMDVKALEKLAQRDLSSWLQ
ncbi:sulfotransferase family protein [Alicyclobacillus fodiniaquatilis]|uniref:Sulfotransferase family protein n=1 Tax=Alicyclobacillus fodiniaquatilis TaxID=1661150 RepID=A0ABW4JFG5_9BACL